MLSFRKAVEEHINLVEKSYLVLNSKKKVDYNKKCEAIANLDNAIFFYFAEAGEKDEVLSKGVLKQELNHNKEKIEGVILHKLDIIDHGENERVIFIVNLPNIDLVDAYGMTDYVYLGDITTNMIIGWYSLKDKQVTGRSHGELY